MNALALAHFAQPLAAVTPLPKGPRLSLPAGEFGVLERGRLFWHDRWIVAVGLSDRLFLVVGGRSSYFVHPHLLDQLIGYLSACGCEILLVNNRSPLVWHRMVGMDTITGLWVKALLAEQQAQGLLLSIARVPQPPLALPLAVFANNAAEFWQTAKRVADELDPGLNKATFLTRTALLQMSQDWEHRWNLYLAGGDVATATAEDWAAVQRCDAVWESVVRHHLLPHGYQFQPASVARLL